MSPEPSSKEKANIAATAAAKATAKIQIWLIFNLVLSFFLIVGQLLILGSMQQIYNRMIAIQSEYAEYYAVLRETTEERKTRERGETGKKQWSNK